MKKKANILFIFLFTCFIVVGQDSLRIAKEDPTLLQVEMEEEETEELLTVLSDSISSQSDSIAAQLTDSVARRAFLVHNAPRSLIDSTKIINYWKITRQTGEMVRAIPDTFLTDYFNRTNVEGYAISVAYPGNLGLPMESRIFFDRKDRSEFIFLDPYWAYAKQPDEFLFINTKIPHSNISYQTAGGRDSKEERLQALLAVNYGKKLNFGFDVDYIYARGFYDSQSSKHLEWTLFSNYISDRHQLHLFLNSADYTNGENGGLVDDGWVTKPDTMSNQNLGTKEFPTRFTNTWNKIKGGSYYLNYHYNLGFEQETTGVDEEGKPIMQFIPVSSIIYTFDYTHRKRRFYTADSLNLDRFYGDVDHLNPRRPQKRANDSTSYNLMRNTLALSLREGARDWVKFDLTAFITQEIRNYTLMDSLSVDDGDTLFASKKERLYATYIGAELAKRRGKYLRYNAQGKLGILGDNIGDFELSGTIETSIPFLKQVCTVSADAFIKNISPTFYENHYHSKYFWWDNDFGKVKKVFVGGSIDLPLTGTKFRMGVENLTDYIYFDANGYPQKHSGNIQILGAILQQNIKLGILHWDNRLTYQSSSKQNIIPLPDFAAYTSLYIDFKIARVLTVQMGGNMHYWTEYYSPTYNPATQQFILQDEKTRVKVGNYPLIGAFLNCHLKQARFFLQYYNAGSSFINPPEYFSLPHYPVNPTVLRMGISVDFIN